MLTILIAVPNIGENIKRLREAARLTQSEFARAVASARGGERVSKNWISDLERGRYPNPDTRNLLAFAKVLSMHLKRAVSIDDLIVGVDDDYDAQLQRSALNAPDASAIVAVSSARFDVETDAPSSGEGSSGGEAALVATIDDAPLHPTIRRMLVRIAAVIHETVGAADAALTGQAPSARARAPNDRAKPGRQHRRNSQR